MPMTRCPHRYRYNQYERQGFLAIYLCMCLFKHLLLGANWFDTMFGENRQLVADEPVEVEKEPVEVGESRRITDPFRGIFRIYLK